MFVYLHGLYKGRETRSSVARGLGRKIDCYRVIARSSALESFALDVH